MSCVIWILAAAAPVRADGWDYVYGDPGPANYSRYQAVKLAPDGSTYMGGFYSGSFNGLSSPAAYRYFLQRVSANGTVAWTREMNTVALDPSTIPKPPDLEIDGLGNPIVKIGAQLLAYDGLGTSVANVTTVADPIGVSWDAGSLAPAIDGGVVAIVQPGATSPMSSADYELQRRRADLSTEWTLSLAGLVEPVGSCRNVCPPPAVMAVSDGTFWVVGQKNRVLATQQDALSMVHVSATGTKIASILNYGITPYVWVWPSGFTPLLAATDSFIWVSVQAGDIPHASHRVVSFSTQDGSQLGTVPSTLPSDDITTSKGTRNCGGVDFINQLAYDPSIGAMGPQSLRRSVLVNGTRLVVLAYCGTQDTLVSGGNLALMLLSYSMNSALGGGYSLTASRELSTTSTVYAMDADGAGNAVVVGSTTGGVVYAGPIQRVAPRTEAAGSNEQAVAARNPLGNLNAVSEYKGLTPTRLFDTRPTEANGAVVVAKGKIGGATTLTVKVAGKLGIPANGAGAVSLNVTVVDPEAAGYLTVYPCGTPPTASNLNFTAGQTVANAVVAPLSANGEVCLASNVATHVLADVNGWFRSGLGFTAVPPLRVFDTRPDSPQGAVPVDQHPYGGVVELKVKVAGVGGVPLTNVGAVSLNVTAVGPEGAGFVTVYPCGTRPNASNLNFVAGQIVPNAVIAPVSANGEVCLFSSVNTHLLADVNGWFAIGSSFNALTPVRIVDTRPTEAQGAVAVTKQKYGPSTVLKFTITGADGVPAAGVSAVALNVTVVDPDGAGFVTAFPCGDRPLASNVNFVAGQTIPNAVVVPISPAGEVCFFSNTPTHILVDVNGWISA